MTLKYGLLAGLALVSFMAPFSGAGDAQASGRYCREYTKSIRVGGRLEEGYGRACMQPDGAWEIVSLDGSDQAQDIVRDDIRESLYEENPRVVIVDRYTPVYYRPVVRPVYFGFDDDAPRFGRGYGWKRGYEDRWCGRNHGRGHGHGHEGRGHREHHDDD